MAVYYQCCNHIIIKTILILMTVILNAPFAQCLLAYDCAGRDMNITSISLIDTSPCPDYKIQNVTDDLEIQVLQERETYETHVYQCLIEIDYHATYCGMHSHASEVRNGIGTILYELLPSECRDVHKDLYVMIYGNKITGLKRNSSVVIPTVLAGSVTFDGACTGAPIVLGVNSWTNVLVTSRIKILLTDHTAIHRVSDDMIIMKSGLSCKFSDGQCTDAKDGFLTWTTDVLDKCSRDSHLVLYRGKATRVNVQSTQSLSDVYTTYVIKEGGFLATLTRDMKRTVCGFSMYKTDHPKLLVHETNGVNPYFIKDILTPSNMDIFLYVNAKITHLEKHLRTELTGLYENLAQQYCETRRDVLKTQLALATIDPVEFAYVYMKQPGYTGIVMGEQIHVIKCRAVYVSVRTTKGCYNELPVNYTNLEMFMSPRSHILQKTGTPVSCSVMMQPVFKLAGSWFSAENGLSRAPAPAELSPSMDNIWSYTDAGDLAKEGIYSQEDINKLRSQLMFPSERRAITQMVSSAINQDTTQIDTSMFKHLLTKEVVEQSFKSFLGDTWSRFLTFGSFFSGIFGLMLTFKLIKWLFDTVIHSRGLYEVYGCGWQIIGSAWDAVTTYLLSPVTIDKFSLKKTKKPPSYEDSKISEEIPTAPKLYPTDCAMCYL